jgi:hypothetical protein
MELTDNIWQELEGGYRTPYDVSIPLRKLEEIDDPEIMKPIWEELWNELHHQGDVGIASYLAIPQIVKIGINKEIIDWNLLGICCVIEQQRILGDNPDLPKDFENYYANGLASLKILATNYLERELDKTTLIIALSTIALFSGQIKLSKAIMEFEDEDMLDEFLLQF